MASLFATLKNLNEITNATDNSGGGGGDNDRKQPNLKVGAVNGFFTDLAKRFGDWFIELMQKFFHYLQTIMSNKNRRKSGSVPVNFYQCSQNKNNESKITTRKPESSRIRRNTEQSSSSSMPIDLEQFASDYSEMYRHPFQFVQLMDGSIQNIKLSELDQDPNIIQFKKFIIRSFGTQLDERKKRIIEIDELGTHYCHYQMEFDEPDVNKKPVHYLNQRSKRHSYEDDHIVSIMRQFKSDDIIVKRHNNRLPKSRSYIDDNLKSESVMNFMDFNVQEIQLVRNNMVVASGGYFQGFMPILTPTTPTTKNDDRSKRSTKFDKHDLIDKYLRKHLDLNMQYSMVVNPSSMETPPTPPATIINYVDRIVKHFGFIITRLSNSKRDNNDQTTKIEEFETRYKIAASLFGIDLIDGQINLSKKSNNDSWLILNLFGSTYENLNLCEIRNKDYSQSGIIPLFVEDIWFKTNIAIKIHYKLNLKLDIPFLNCNNQPKNNEILKRVINDELELKQNAMMEFAVVAEANFLIVNAKMRLNGKFDMDSMVDFTGTCLSAKTFVKPMDIVSDIQYEFYHPICGEWMMDHWKPKPLSWKLNKDYHRSWSTPNNTCV
ncbi:hypothetical protein DERP_003073 [Dermatophagoides pteronyssinus]|uniref:Uncharacterized protein n=1 Tax=Dermatophagoides pteronyssinus TaxID=6956 RepID=A0ABQ8JIY2_DERPT|nr:hypothetical protein DERP_003073 [Dermatophagoides pteronyssinus]